MFKLLRKIIFLPISWVIRLLIAMSAFVVSLSSSLLNIAVSLFVLQAAVMLMIGEFDDAYALLFLAVVIRMQETVDSIAENGILVPAIARPRPEGGYELISGHRRKHGCELLGLETMPVIVRDLTDDQAILMMIAHNNRLTIPLASL